MYMAEHVPTRTYIGERHGDTGLVRVLVDDGTIRVPLEHHVRHSPTGFEWGYGGSGPSDLARCILIDHFDSYLHTDPLEGALAHYQDFKFAVVAGLPREGFELTSLQVQEWIDAHKAEWAAAEEGEGGDDG